MVQASVSQSVERTIRVLALFGAERRPMGRGEICEALDAPRSSMAALLLAMTELGLLSNDRATQTYFPTARLGRLAGWIDQMFSIDSSVVLLMKRLQEATRETVTLSAPLHHILEVVHLEPGLNSVAYVATIGQMLPLWGSAVGNAFLSTQPDKMIAELHRRARQPGPAWPVPAPFDKAMEAVVRTRRDGYSLVVGSIASDAAALAMPLPAQSGAHKQLVIALAGPGDRISRDEVQLVRTLRQEIAAMGIQTAPAASSGHFAQKG